MEKGEGRGGSLETGLDRSERIETCFDMFKRVNLNGLKRVSTGSNVFRHVQTGLDRSERIETCFDRFQRGGGGRRGEEGKRFNRSERVSTGSNVFQQVQTCFNRSGQI